MAYIPLGELDLQKWLSEAVAIVMAPTKVNTPEGWAPTSLPPLVFANPCLSWCRLSNSPFYMSIRVTGFYRVKDQHVSSLMKMTREEKDNFQPQPSEADRRYEKSSHVEIVDSLLPPTVVDTRKSLEDARAKGAAHELPIQDGEVGEGTRGEKRPRSSDEVVGGPSQGEEGVEGGGGTGDRPPEQTRKKRGGARR